MQEIVEGNDWRSGEFARFKANQNKVEPDLWYRMCIPMIYAHWEGFVVDALKIMLKHLNGLNLKYSVLPTKLIVLSIGDSYKSLSGKQSFSQRIEFTDKFKSLFNSVVTFKTKVETKSNLKSNVFKELCDIFGFNEQPYCEYLKNVDRLVHIRNSIAHGENNILPTLENITLYIDSVQKCSDLLLIDIENYLLEERFLIENHGINISNESGV
ncbi:MAE_28990/MAE_18760 family HEPN-like nuclease [Providencia manganoxydans]|uniref:MAE_28990/MAE_18760 family HEPN-like nuclease n=1 Tax=Providencia manganoxydans TaxID=2923283 RepID=UPI0032DB3E33